jgi:hypothetical protein
MALVPQDDDAQNSRARTRERTGTHIFYSVHDKMQMASDEARHDLHPA